MKLTAGMSLNAAIILKREDCYIVLVIFQFLLVWNLYQVLLGVYFFEIIEEEIAMAHMTQAQQKKVVFTDDELEKIVSYIPYEENITYQDDENVKHPGIEIYRKYFNIISKE